MKNAHMMSEKIYLDCEADGVSEWTSQHLYPLHHFVHAQIPEPFYQNPLVPVLLLPFIANPPSEKHRRENERQKWRGAKSLRGEGPIKRAPFFSKECAQRWREMKELKGKKCSLYFLKIDLSFTLRGRLTGRQVVVWIEGKRE